jgi:hypothetical protein
MKRNPLALRSGSHPVRGGTVVAQLPTMIRRRGAQAGYIYVEYLVILICVGIVITLALFELGPGIVKNYTAQKKVLLEEGP